MQDLMQYLYDEWEKEKKNTYNPTVAGFKEWCQEHLKKNPPKTLTTVDYGVGFRLMDETEVAIVVQPEEPMGTMGIQVNQAGPARNIPDTRCAQVMGKQETRLH